MFDYFNTRGDIKPRPARAKVPPTKPKNKGGSALDYYAIQQRTENNKKQLNRRRNRIARASRKRNRRK